MRLRYIYTHMSYSLLKNEHFSITYCKCKAAILERRLHYTKNGGNEEGKRKIMEGECKCTLTFADTSSSDDKSYLKTPTGLGPLPTCREN